MKRRFKIIIEKTSEGYVAYPIGLKGVIIGDGETFEEALDNVRSAIVFHVQTFGEEVLGDLATPEDIYIAETELAV